MQGGWKEVRGGGVEEWYGRRGREEREGRGWAGGPTIKEGGIGRRLCLAFGEVNQLPSSAASPFMVLSAHLTCGRVATRAE